MSAKSAEWVHYFRASYEQYNRRGGRALLAHEPFESY